MFTTQDAKWKTEAYEKRFSKNSLLKDTLSMVHSDFATASVYGNIRFVLYSALPNYLHKCRQLTCFATIKNLLMLRGQGERRCTDRKCVMKEK